MMDEYYGLGLADIHNSFKNAGNTGPTGTSGERTDLGRPTFAQLFERITVIDNKPCLKVNGGTLSINNNLIRRVKHVKNDGFCESLTRYQYHEADHIIKTIIQADKYKAKAMRENLAIPDSMLYDIICLMAPLSYWSSFVESDNQEFFGDNAPYPVVLRRDTDVMPSEFFSMLLSLELRGYGVSFGKLFSCRYGASIANSKREFSEYGIKNKSYISVVLTLGTDKVSFAFNAGTNHGEFEALIADHNSDASKAKRYMAKLQKYIDECRASL